MLIEMIRNLQGYVKIRAEGYSPERFLNLCNAHQIFTWDIEYHKEFYVLRMKKNDYKKIRPFVQKTGTKTTILEKKGAPFFWFRFRKRKLFFAGVLISALLIYSLSLFVWNIRIEGNVTQQTEEVLDYLETLGVRHGARKSEISCEEIERKMRMKYSNMLWVSAELRGTRVLIRIKENTDADIVSKISEKESDAFSIVAKTSGVIQSMIVRSGTPMVSVGDTVEEGEILVEGYYEIKNDANEIVRYEGVCADADIEIQVVKNYEDQFSSEYEKKIFTDRKRMGIRLQILRKRISWSPKIPFRNYEIVSQKRKIRITENFYLPFTGEILWYLEYEMESIGYTEEEIEKIAEKRFYDKYQNILQKGVQIIEKDVKIDRNGKVCNVKGSVKLLVSDMRKIPTNIPKIANAASLEGEH